MDVSPLPYVEIGKLLGMLVYLEDLDGKTDVYAISDDMGLEMDELVNIIKVAELLGFVEVKEGDLYITEIGKDIVYGDENRKKTIFKRAIKKLSHFRRLVGALKHSQDQSIPKSKVLDFLLEEMSEDEANESLKSIIELGRYAELIGYNPESKELYLDKVDEE